MRVLDLFSGIGGFSLGLERAGMQTIAFCEIDPFCRAVLAKHWPTVPIFEDVRALHASDVSGVDVICGGFPCQDISVAGKGAGLQGERSGLWREYARLVGEIRPQYVIVENVAALLGRGLGDVLGDLAALGYDAEWHCIPASFVGAQHERDRVWIIAYADSQRQLQPQGVEREEWRRLGDGIAKNDADIDEARLQGGGQTRAHGAHAEGLGPRYRFAVNDAPSFSMEYWDHQPVLGGRLHGVPNRLDRVAALGNAVVPQIPEMIGRALMATQREAA